MKRVHPPETHPLLRATTLRSSPAAIGALAAALFLFGTAVCMLALHHTARGVLREAVHADMTSLARIAADRIDLRAHAALVDSTQQNGPLYLEVVAPLREILASAPHIQYLYTARLSPAGVVFAVDASEPIDGDQDGVLDQAGLGEVYDDADPAMLEAFSTGLPTLTKEPYTDKWGTFMTAFVPLRDEEGRLECVLGLDVNAKTYLGQLAAMNRAAAWGFGAACVASIVFGLLVFRMQRRGRRAALALEESEAQFREMADATPVMVRKSGRDGGAIYFNRVWFDFTGRTDAEERGKGWLEGVFPEDRPAALAWIDARFAERAPFEIEYRLRRFDGEYRWILDRGVPQFSRAGDFEGFIGGCVDITPRKRAEEDLRNAKEMAETLAERAEAANRTKSDFLATVSHELRTPMNGVLGFTGLLLESPLTAQQREFAEIIQGSGQGLLALLNDILDFSKIEAGKLELEHIPFDLGEVIEQVSELLCPRAEEKGLELVLRFDPDVPRRRVGDPARVRQILLNLTGNAIKFTERGEVLIRVSVATDPARSNTPEGGDHHRVSIRVTDTGLGIPRARQTQLFTKFTQVDSSTTRRFGGTGLGLAISRTLVEHMGGRIGLESEIGRGSTFWFDLPLSIADEPHHARDPRDTPRLPEDTRVLLIGGIPALRSALTAQLESWHLPHDTVDSWSAALPRLKEARDRAVPLVSLFAASESELTTLTDGEWPGPDSPLAFDVVLLAPPSRRRELSPLHERDVATVLSKPLVRPAALARALERASMNGADSDRTLESSSGAQPLQAPTEASRARLDADPSSAAARPRILLAEDNKINQRLMLHLLRRDAYEIDIAENGAEAVRAASATAYDLILMDCQMPELDGFEATAEIRRQERPGTRVPILALTANALLSNREICLESGMDDFLTKPIDPPALRAAIVTWLERGRDRRAA